VNGMEMTTLFSRHSLKLRRAVFVIAAGSLAVAWAADEKNPDGRAVLMRMADYLAKSPAWGVTVHTSYDAVQPDGYKVEWNDIRTVTLKRPDRLRVESEKSDGTRSLVLFDGKTITTFDESARVYAQQLHPGSVDDAVVYFVQNLGMRLPLALMLRDSFPAELQQRVQTVKYVERTATLGAPADHIAASTPTVDFQVWVAQGDRPLPLRVVLTYKSARGQPQFRAEFSDWNLAIQPSESLFAFTPPAGVKRIPFAATLAGIAPARTRVSGPMKGGKQ
jgi:hypothetical protein